MLGAGPAGLTAAYVLGLRGARAAVFEADGTVGGLAKTVEFGGYRFDLGGHRFFTKLEPLERLWEDLLGDDFLVRPRLSRIHYAGDYFSYPLRAREVPGRLGVLETLRCLGSYAAGRLASRGQPETFEEWVTARFGRRLYEAFFRSYTEKVWGIPGSEIRAEWAAQRIKDFSLGKAVASMLGLRRETITTLIEEFRYPRLGPGQMWEALQARVEAQGTPVHLNRRCACLRHDGRRVTSVELRWNGSRREVGVDAVLSTMPLAELVRSLEPRAPDEVLAAADRLRYRDLCLVALMTTEPEPFPDNWIYLHDPGIRAGRVQNFGAWSEDMVRPGSTCLGVEYFCFAGDEIWELSDEQAVRLAVAELSSIGILDPARVVDGVKVRVSRAYPMYDAAAADAVALLREYLAGFENLQTCGRNGLHRYNNQDHSMWTGILAALNLLDGPVHDVWSVNTEAVYHEQGAAVAGVLDLDLVAARAGR